MILFHQQTSTLSTSLTHTMKPQLRLRIALLVGVLALSTSALIQAQTVPNRIDYQGRVLDGNGVPLAVAQPTNYEMEFRIYDADTGGTVIWAEKQLVTVINGQYSVRLGEGQPILNAGNDIGSVPQAQLQNAFNGNSRHLGVTVKIPGQTPGEISPRLSFLSAPFALTAANAANVIQAAGTTSNLTIGSVAYATQTISSSVALDGNSRTVLVNSPTAPVTATLPLSAAQKEILIAKTDTSTDIANQVLVAPPAGGSINGSTSTIRLKVRGESVTLQNVGGDNWWITNDNRDKTPVGTIIAFGGNGNAPAGYIVCDGRSLNRADHPELFAVIGTQWGAPSGTTFNVPTSAGRFLRGIDPDSNGADEDASTRIALLTGGATGRNVGSYQNEDFKAHAHTGIAGPGGAHTPQLVDSNGNAFTNSNTQGGWGLMRRTVAGNNSTPTTSDATWSGTEPDIITTPLAIRVAALPDHTHTLNINSSGGTETRPDNMGVRFLIKY